MSRVAAVAFACAVSGGATHADVDADLAGAVAALPTCEASRGHCVGIQLHVTVEGTGAIAAPDWLAAQLDAANRHFAPADIGFEVTGIDALPASAAHIATPGDRDGLAADRLGGGVIHVFIVRQLDDVDHAGQVIRGVTWHTHKDARKYVIVSITAPERVLAHELGHFFGLPHSTYAVSIMNKRERKQPPLEQRKFADEEIAALRLSVTRLLQAKVIAEVAK